MASYILKRILQLLPVILVIICVNFIIVRLAPGDPIYYLIGDASVTPEFIEELRKQYGFDQPLYKQLLLYLGPGRAGRSRLFVRFARLGQRDHPVADAGDAAAAGIAIRPVDHLRDRARRHLSLPPRQRHRSCGEPHLADRLRRAGVLARPDADPGLCALARPVSVARHAHACDST